MGTAARRGMLAIRSDVAPDSLTDYLHWLTREHTEERVSIPGFEGVRVLRAEVPGAARFLILYDLAGPEVLSSPGYLARLNDPTDWSRRIMPGLGNFARGGGTVLCEAGRGQGGFVAALRLGRRPVADEGAVAALAAADRVCAARLIAVDEAGTGVATAEKALRGGDGGFPGLLLVEALDEGALRATLDANRAALEALGAEEAVVHSVVFALTGAEVRGAR